MGAVLETGVRYSSSPGDDVVPCGSALLSSGFAESPQGSCVWLGCLDVYLKMLKMLLRLA